MACMYWLLILLINNHRVFINNIITEDDYEKHFHQSEYGETKNTIFNLTDMYQVMCNHVYQGHVL